MKNEKQDLLFKINKLYRQITAFSFLINLLKTNINSSKLSKQQIKAINNILKGKNNLDEIYVYLSRFYK